MIEDVGLELVAGGPRVAGPDVALAEANLVEHLRRQTRLVVGERLRIAEAAVHRGDYAGLAAQVPGRAAMSENRAVGDSNGIAWREAGMGSREWGVGTANRVPIPHSPFPTPHSPSGFHHGIFSFETLRPAFSWRARISAMRASTSSRVKISCSTTRLRTARIHFS